MIEDRIRERLQAELGTTFRIIEGAIALATIKGRPTALPAAYVVPVSEVSAENYLGAGAIRQLTEVDVMVVIATSDVSDPRGQAAGTAVGNLRTAVRTALLGFVPEGAEVPITHVSGLLGAAQGGVVWWEETFATSYYLEVL